MQKLQALKKATTKPELARLLGIKPSVFTYCLYVVKTENQYLQFKIPKKNGGERVINAPTGTLKTIQTALSKFLLDCADEINFKQFPSSNITKETAKNSKFLKIKFSNGKAKQPSLSHGFERNRSIITNAMMHLGRKNVLNIDLENFFGSFNFGRVRGFFLKNENFNLDPQIATALAKIACHNNELPQGSPCSPVITNLIVHSLDIRLAKIALDNSSIYTRYADDITFSTRRKDLPKALASEKDGALTVSNKLRSEIRRSGFSINDKKTRNQYRDSRQDVTGLIVNKKPNTKKEYWRTVRAQCCSLFRSGEFTQLLDGVYVNGNNNRLEGKLNFIDQVDHYNRLRQHPPLNPKYQPKKEALRNNHAKLRRYLHTGREDTFSKFLFYRFFYANELPTILTEGKTDNVYLKSAIHTLASSFPLLASTKTATSEYKLSLRFVEYSERTRYLLELHGGSDYLKDFIINYKNRFGYYKAPKPKNPVIIFVDNDDGPKDLISYVNKIDSRVIFPATAGDVRSSDFVYVFHNLYLVLTPRKNDGSQTDVEYFFNNTDRLRSYKGKCFNTVENRDPATDLSKDAFAMNVIHANKQQIDFSGFIQILGRIVKVLDHYNSVK